MGIEDEARPDETPEPKPEPPKPTTPQEAAKIIQDERKARARACWEAVEAVLNHHDCGFRARPYIDDDGATRAEFFVHPN